MTRAKFHCHYKNESAKIVELSPVYDGSEENKAFFEATPGGHVVLNVVNPTGLAAFEQGKDYYIDFTPAE